MLEQPREADSVLVEAQSKLSERDALLEEWKDKSANIENNLLEEKNNLKDAEQVLESMVFIPFL